MGRRGRRLLGAAAAGAVCCLGLAAPDAPATAAPASTTVTVLAPTLPTTQPATAPSPAAPPEADVDRLAAQLDDTTRRAAAAVDTARATALDALHLRFAAQDAQRSLTDTRQQLARAIRLTLSSGSADPTQTLVATLHGSDEAGLLGRVQGQQLRDIRTQLDRLRAERAHLDQLSRQARERQQQAMQDAANAETAADAARRTLATAQQAHLADVQRQLLAAQQTELDRLDAELVDSLAPVATDLPTAAAASAPPGVDPGSVPTAPSPAPLSGPLAPDRQAAVQTLLASGPPGTIPPGFHATGQTIRGVATWYGPGFIGAPTSSGVPYDPEKLTAAMLAVPLGTVVRVVRLDGRGAVTVQVNDHGPYGPGRVIDLSVAANRLIGDLGMGPVLVEVLAPDG